MNNRIISLEFTAYNKTVAECMEAAGAPEILSNGRPVMLKPNLINDSPHPITTSPSFCEAVIAYVRKHTQSPVVIAEGCGDSHLETPDVFERLGYHRLVVEHGVELLDLNHAPLVKLENKNSRIFPEIWLPRAIFDHILISLPVLKAHSLCKFTGSMKNMIGTAPPKHYSGRFGSWKKAVFHEHLDDAIVELNQYRSPDFTLMDATIGMADFHLGGPTCDPPVNRILGGMDAKAVDREAAGLLGMDWTGIGHLK